MANILFQTGGPYEDSYLPVLKSILGGKANVTISKEVPVAVTETLIKARKYNCTQVLTTSPRLVQRLLGRQGDKLPSLDNYMGSLYKRQDIEILVLPPLEQFFTKKYGKFLFERYISKFLRPENWLPIPEFSWELFAPSKASEYLELAKTATLISIDIETIKDPLSITCCGFSFISISATGISARTVTIPFTDVFNIEVARQLCATSAPKVGQNFKYDIAHLLRYNIPVVNYCFDTMNAFHCWYCELPKDLGFVTSFMLRDWQYHKDEADNAKDLLEYYQYNAKDCFSTGFAFLQWLSEAPSYSLRNYTIEFPTVFPCILAEQTGIKVDMLKMAELNEVVEKNTLLEKAKLQVMVADERFNPGSWQQKVKLFAILGSGDIKSSDDKHMDKVASRHPLNKRIVKDIQSYMENAKLRSSYTRDVHPKTGARKTWHGRHYYSLNPHSTDTARLASKSSAYWCGDSIQTIPREDKVVDVKSMYIADNGFFFGEADGEQAETRGTGYITGDTGLIKAVEDHTKDFHGLNASSFFGVPYNEIMNSYYDPSLKLWIHKKLDKVLRDLSKRTNHGANYNMGAFVLLETMGIENVIRAKRLLKLNTKYTFIQVCQWLLNKFDETYPIVRGEYHKHLILQVATSKMLVSALGWTRYCFGNPVANKMDLNALAAHAPQNLNAGILNKAWVNVFNTIWMENQDDFKLVAQIHDSILFMYRIGRIDLAFAVKKAMEITVPVTDIFGIRRDLLVPVALKGESERWSDMKEIREAA